MSQNIIEAIQKLYERQAGCHEIGRRRLGRGLTLGEKILFSHLIDPENQEFDRKKIFPRLTSRSSGDARCNNSNGFVTIMVAGKKMK